MVASLIGLMSDHLRLNLRPEPAIKTRVFDSFWMVPEIKHAVARRNVDLRDRDQYVNMCPRRDVWELNFHDFLQT